MTEKGNDRNYLIRRYTFPGTTVLDFHRRSDCSRPLLRESDCRSLLDLGQLLVSSDLCLGRGRPGVYSGVGTGNGTNGRTFSGTVYSVRTWGLWGWWSLGRNKRGSWRVVDCKLDTRLIEVLSHSETRQTRKEGSWIWYVVSYWLCVQNVIKVFRLISNVVIERKFPTSRT